MSLLVVFQIGIREVAAHKFRSVLSMLGIVLGVSSLIATMALTRGMEEGTRTFMQQLGGLELVTIAEKNPSSLKMDFANLSPGLTLRDAQVIRESASLISHVSPEIAINSLVSSFGQSGTRERRMIRGIYPDHFVIRMHQIGAGRFLSDLDVQRGARCVVLGNTVATQLWPDASIESLIGKTVLIGTSPFEVVGVLDFYQSEEQARIRRSGKTSMRWRWDPFRIKNETVLIPFTTLFHEFRSGVVSDEKPNSNKGNDSAESKKSNATMESSKTNESIDSIELEALIVRVRDLDYFRPALDQLRKLLDITHRGVDDFDFETREDWFDRVESSVRAARLSGGLISAISLIVGGIGIMNIMLASISERVREIGIRMAVGARPRDIFLQIITEGMFISLIGAFLGIGASLGLIEILKLISPTENVPVLSWDGVLFSVVFALLAGLLSGIYPGLKAARLDPISALRYE
jgi:putative ABC transport system permease protein